MVGYDILTFCSSSYLNVLSLFVDSWVESDCDSIRIYTDYGYERHAELIDRRFSSRKISIIPFIAVMDDFGSNCATKALAVESDMRLISPGRNILLLDCDCLVLRPLGDLYERDFEIAVTVPPSVIGTGIELNNPSAGAVFVKHNALSKAIVRRWLDLQVEVQDRNHRCRDQQALYLALSEARGLAEANILALPNTVWNSFPTNNGSLALNRWFSELKENEGDVKILHFAVGTYKDKENIDRAKNISLGLSEKGRA